MAGPKASPVKPRTEHLLYPEVSREIAPLEGDAGRDLTPCGWEDPGPRDVVSIGGELLCDALDLTSPGSALFSAPLPATLCCVLGLPCSYGPWPVVTGPGEGT